MIPVACAIISVLAAALVLLAPALRPALSDVATAWLGQDNGVSRLLLPDAPIQARTEHRIAGLEQENASLLRQVAGLTDDSAAMRRQAAALQDVLDQMSKAVGGQGLPHALGALVQQTRQLKTTGALLGARLQATGLVALSLRLRRDLDGGLPVEADRSAIAASGPFPAEIDKALKQLHDVGTMAPTMHDLAVGLDAIIARVAAREAAGQSWGSQGWEWMSSFVWSPAERPLLSRELVALAADARFSAAADLLDASPMAASAKSWTTQVRNRANAVLATQLIMSYALNAYGRAYAPAPDDAGQMAQ